MNWTMRTNPGRRNRRRGMLTLEWIFLITVLVIGIVGGLAAVRNALLNEILDLAAAIENLNIGPDPDMDASASQNFAPVDPPIDPQF